MTEADPLAEIEFLAGSPNRIEVLAQVIEEPRTRQDLEAALDVSQPTLGRILQALSERYWVRAEGGRYEATATGRLVAAGITDLRDRLETETRLREVVEWLPTEAMDVDFRHLGDATITTPSQTQPNAPIRRMLALIRETDHVRLLSHAFNEQKLDLIHERARDGDLTTRGVFAAAAIEAVSATPALRERLEEVTAAEGVEIRTYDGEVPLALEITDDRVHLLLRDAEGIVRASLDTPDEAVREWAERAHERYWTEATPLTLADVAE